MGRIADLAGITPGSVQDRSISLGEAPGSVDLAGRIADLAGKIAAPSTATVESTSRDIQIQVERKIASAVRNLALYTFREDNSVT